jgi:hypothetical protein
MPNSNAPGIQADDFAEGMYDAGARGAFDTLALHPYGTTEASVLGQVESLRATMARHGDTAPIWVTEFGWGTGGPPTSLTVSDSRQADLIAGTARTLYDRRDELGLRGFVYYQWADGTPGGTTDDSVWFHVGLVDTTRSPKPSLPALTGAIGAMGLADDAGDAPAGPLPDRCRLTPSRTAPPAALTGPGANPGGGGGAATQAVQGGGTNADVPSAATVPPGSPVLRRVKLRPARFRAAGSGPALKPLKQCGSRTACGRAGTRLTFQASAPGMLELRVRRVRDKHVKDVPGIVRQGVARGPGALRLLGWVGKTRLAPGAYRAIVQLVGRDGRRSRAASVRFAVVR